MWHFLGFYSRCEVIVSAFEDAQKVKVSEDTCEECRSQLVSVEYKAVSRSLLSLTLPHLIYEGY